MSRILITGGAGYIGSVLAAHLIRQEHSVVLCDPMAADVTAFRYQDIARNGGLDVFDTIIHLAAHSSVGACEDDPCGAIDNNLVDVIDFARKLSGQTFIFASTGSIRDPNTTMLYDTTKRAAEQTLPHIYPATHILRFGTVCGVSPVMREDLILNGMVRDAVRTGVITVRNPGAWRPVLFFADLCQAIDLLVTGGSESGVYDLASFQTKIGGWADMVAKETGARIVDEGLTPHYSFRMPVLPKSFVTPEAAIRELMEFWRAKT